MLDKAIEYINQGYKIFPLYPNSKIPMTPNGFHDATRNPAQVRQWWTDEPNANIGLPTGKENNLTVIDVDPEGIVTHDNFPDQLKRTGVKVHTPREGLHYYYEYNPNLKTTAGLWSGIDVRNDGGYIVAPGSEIGGKEYQCLENFNPQMQPLPPFFLAKQESNRNTRQEAPVTGEGIGIGGRNNGLTVIAGSLRKQGLGEDTILEMLLLANENECDPPLSEREVAKIAQSVARYAPEPTVEENTAEVVKASDLTDSMLEYLKDKDAVKGESTGIAGLDKLMGGGLRLGEVTALHAEAKQGKNTFLHQVVYNKLEEGYPIGYASRELSGDTEVLPNLLSIKLGLNAWTEEPRAEEYKHVIDSWPLYFTSGYGYLPLESLSKWFKTCHEEHGVELFLLDHLHYTLEEPEDHKAASKLIKEVKTLAKQLNVHIVVIIQPNKIMEGQSLGKNTIKGGSAIGQAIDNLLVYERRHDDKTVARLSLNIARSKLAKLGNIYMKYDPKTTRLFECEYQPPAETEQSNEYSNTFSPRF